MKNNCYVVVNTRELPRFGGEFETPEAVYEFYNRYETFTGRVFSSKRAASAEMRREDERVPIGGDGYVVCGCICRQFG